MDEFFKMDVFFFVATIAVAVVSILLSIVLYRIYRILGGIEHLTQQVSDEANAIRADMKDVRAVIRHQGLKFKHAMKLFARIFARKKSR